MVTCIDAGVLNRVFGQGFGGLPNAGSLAFDQASRPWSAMPLYRTVAWPGMNGGGPLTHGISYASQRLPWGTIQQASITMNRTLPSPVDIVARRLSRIPGCQLVESGPNHALTGTPSSFVFEGIGPSLHRMTMEWEMRLEACMDRPSLLREIDRLVAIQRRRRTSVTEQGLGMGSGFAMRVEIHHICVDRIMHGILVGDALSAGAAHGAHIDAYRRTINSILTSRNQSACDGYTMANSSGTIMEIGGAPLLLMPRNVGIGSFDGMHLSVPFDPPETTVALMPGRRVRDVVDVPPHLEVLSTRQIASATKASGWLTITMEADPVRIADVGAI